MRWDDPARQSVARLGEGSALLALAVCLCGLTWWGCASARPGAPGDPVALSVGVPLPASRTGETVGVRQLASLLSNEGLLRTRRDGTHEARLAERWEVADGGRRVTVHLRAGLRFADGTPLTAREVTAALEAARAEPWQPYQYPMLEDIEAIETVGPLTVVLHLRRASALLLDDLEVPIRKRDVKGQLVGAGPFMFESETTDMTIMRANPHYYQGRPQIDLVHLKTYPTVRAAWTAMMRGEVDFLYEIPADARGFVENESAVRVFTFPRPYAFLVAFNLQHPRLRDRDVRRALNLAVNRRWIIDRGLGGHGTPAAGHVWPLHWAYGGLTPEPSYAPARAEALLDRLGYRLPDVLAAATRTAMSSRLRFTCLVAPRVSAYERIALLVQKQLFDIGVDMDIEAVELDEFIRRTDSGQFEAVLVDFAGGYSLTKPYQFWRSSDRPLFSGFGYTAADEALDAVRFAPNADAFRRAVAALQRVFTEDPPALFLAWSETARAVSRRFDVPGPDDEDPLRSIWAWQLARPGGAARPPARSLRQ